MFRRADTRTYTLRRAAAVIFALMSVLPLLLFAYTLYALDVPRHYVAQIGLGSALALSLIGFYIYSAMISRLAKILRDLEADGFASPASGTRQGPGVTMAAEGRPTGEVATDRGPGVARQIPGPPSDRPRDIAARGRSGAGGRSGLVVPGIGRIIELKPADARALSDLDSLWRAEAQPLLGKRVVVAVRNAPDPITGILVQASEDGLILDHEGGRLGISYMRVSAIEAHRTGESA